MYDVVKYIHIVAAIIWVGGAAYAQVYALRAQRSSDPMERVIFMTNAEWIGTRLFLPASLVIILAGAWMTIDRWSFSQAWITIAIALWFVSAIAGAMYVGPRLKRAAAIVAAEGPSSPAFAQLTSRLFLVSRIELVSFAIIVGLMVFKPGAG